MAKKKEGKKNVMMTFLCFLIIGISVVSSFSNYRKIQVKNREKQSLLTELEKLTDEEKILTDDVEKLKNPEYAARYAREKYLYSKDGEKILKIN